MAGEQGKYSRNVWNRQEALRLQKQQAALEKAAERERKLQETATGKAEAERLNADVAARVAQLESILGQGLDREAALDLSAMSCDTMSFRHWTSARMRVVTHSTDVASAAVHSGRNGWPVRRQDSS